MKKYTKIHTLFWGITILLTSCSTKPDVLFETLSYAKKSPWQVSLVLEEQTIAASLAGPLLGYSHIEGEAFVQDDGSWIIHLDSLEWFHNHHKGWTEGSLTMVGTIRLVEIGDSWTIEVIEEPRIDGVIWGTIRYNNSIVSGDRGRDQLQRRWARIDALQDLIHENLSEESYPFIGKVPRDKESPRFDCDLKTLLFPELTSYPEGITPSPRIMKAEGIKWDQAYSEHLLPEEWQELRDSGTLYRDYEEGLPLFWTIYNWDYFWGEFSAKQLKIIEE